MSEYIKRETVLDALKQKSYPLQSDNGKGFVVIDDGIFCDDATDIINAIPAADVEPVVRCKDCVKWGKRDCKRNPCAIDISSMDEFCSDGERNAHMERSDSRAATNQVDRCMTCDNNGKSICSSCIMTGHGNDIDFYRSAGEGAE